MTAFSELLATALVGTDRRAPSTVEDPAAAVLDEAAAWAAYRRAGIRAVTGVARPAPAAADETTEVSDAATRRLTAMLDAEVPGIDAASRAALLDEWLQVAAERGRRVPGALLPRLLDHGRHARGLRPAIAAVGGARVQWLAPQNPDWRYLTGVESTSDDPEAWAMGTAGQRVGYLRGLRAADPAEARSLLEEEWATLSPDERPELMAALAVGLSLADEPLLERALDDRRREVRDVAVRLLSVLPGSAYGKRMVARRDAFLTRRDGVVVAVSPPAECDASMRRDGIPARPPTGVGARAWWLAETLARTPLDDWPAPSGEVVVGDAVEWAPTIHMGLAAAAAAQRDTRWASRLLDRLGDSPTERELAAALYPAVGPDELVERATAALKAGSVPRWGALLAGCPNPWPEALSRLVITGLETLSKRLELAGDVHRLSRLAAVRMPPVLAEAARRLAQQTNAESPAAPALDLLSTMLGFRYEMIMEIG